ncbi:MAG: ABC transporter ATP-binding protein [Bacillus sp. (in: firmicutes)]
MFRKEIVKPFRYKKVLNPEDIRRAGGKKKEKTKDMKSTIRRIWNLLTVKKTPFLFVLLLVLMSSALSLAGPVMIGHIIDDYIVGGPKSGLATILVILASIYLGYSISLWLQNFVMIGIAQKTVQYMRGNLFRQFHRLPISFFDKRQVGELMSRITNDIENVSSTLNSSVIQVFSSTLTLVGTVTVMFWLSPPLALITLLTVPVMYYGMRWITRRTGKLFKMQQGSLGEVNGTIEETISGQRIIKAFSQEAEVAKTFEENAERLRQTGYWAQVYSGNIPKLMNLLNNLNYAIIAGAGGYFAFRGWITIGVIVVFLEYSRQFTRPLNDLANQFNTMLSAIAGAERVFDILDSPKENAIHAGKKEYADILGKVCFQSVTFRYGKEKNPTVSEISFELNPGETLAIVGPTGAGKTTIINMLARFYEHESGTITIDDQDITEYTRGSVRRHMAFVMQENFLFEGSVMDNIRYGRLKADDEEVFEAAKLANAHSFILRLPEGYDTVLEDQGAGLSQGQKQLLAIARALLADPSILILDEATSNIDTITELHIQQALRRLMKGRTSIVIAHRLNTIRHADQIIVLREGRVVEKGTHEELLNKGGFYKDLVGSSLLDSTS